ncbi:Hypothetical Protein FCC1311_036232 [Hondaea fermentalgiana]|uniref:Uncharacterized protein n=1 Tax=Hondaea fermentalgiana TaxID=2315210 RepID=A0A2R5GGL1_9STRA|nr:Hypothetical Protein FCC1311_036232 [Hondaea fermentalgiana]|eukprot:GBG27401.1 Hypothetical Protein FCC1311_036232 [Hondaea fermentalgiana]
MPSALHIHNAGLSDFEYESKDDASQLSSPRSRSWTGEDSMGGHEQKDEVLHDDDPPPLPPLPTPLEDEEAVTPFEIPSPPAALPDMPSPITNVDNVPPPLPPLQDFEDSRAPELSLSSELPNQASEDISGHKPKPPHLPPPTMPGEMSEVGAEGPQEDMSAIFAQLRRNRVPSTTNEGVIHDVINTQEQEQDESLKQQSYVATDSEMSTTNETDLAGRRVLNTSPMPAEPPQEGMSAIFAQLQRNRVPSTTNEAVVHGVAGMQQRGHDEPLDQTPLGTASTEPEVSRFETRLADQRLVSPSSMPTEPSQEGMSAIFAQLQRNRVPSTTNEAVVHGVAKIQQGEHEQIGFMAKGHAQELDKAFEDVKDADLESFNALSKLATKRQVIMESCLEQVRSKPLAEGRAGPFGSADERPRSFSTGFVRRRKPSVHEHDPVELLNKVSHVALKADVAQETVNAVLRECSESRERIHALQQRIDESENILENARIPEDALRSKLAELAAVHRLQRSLQDAEFHTLEKRCEEVAKRIEALGREEKARILDAAERKSAKALGAVRRNLRDSKQRLASEYAQDLAALEEKSKGVDAAMQRKTTAEFRRVLSRQVDVLKEKRAAVETQIADRKHERTLAEREAAVLARDLQQHLLPPVSTRAEADAHIDKLRDQHATSQRKKMDRFERELSLGWSKMRSLGLSEEQAKHKLILLRKLEACIVASPELVHMYQNMVRKLQEAVPILLAEQELGRLGRAVETSAEVLECNQANETAEKEALRAINRLSDAMRELRAERDARRVHWEREHGALPLDWHASQDIDIE